jgi:hypothetical protein
MLIYVNSSISTLFMICIFCFDDIFSSISVIVALMTLGMTGWILPTAPPTPSSKRKRKLKEHQRIESRLPRKV